MWTVGAAAKEGIDVELRNGDFARSWGELGAGVMKPGVPIWGLRICLSVSYCRATMYGERRQTVERMPSLTWRSRLKLAWRSSVHSWRSSGKFSARCKRKKGVKRVASWRRCSVTRGTNRFEDDFHDLGKHGLDIGDTGTRVVLGVVRGGNEMASEGHGWRKEGQVEGWQGGMVKQVIS